MPRCENDSFEVSEMPNLNGYVALVTGGKRNTPKLFEDEPLFSE